VHPCGKAAKALDDAGISYDVKTVQGGMLKPNGIRNSPKTLIAPSQKTYATRFCVPFFCSRALSHTRDAPMIA